MPKNPSHEAAFRIVAVERTVNGRVKLIRVDGGAALYPERIDAGRLEGHFRRVPAAFHDGDEDLLGLNLPRGPVMKRRSGPKAQGLHDPVSLGQNSWIRRSPGCTEASRRRMATMPERGARTVSSSEPSRA